MQIKSIFVLGSTSLIAEELCLALAREGCKKFHLIARDSKKNNFLISKLKNDFQAIVTEEMINLEDENLFNKSLPIVEDYDLYLVTIGTLGNNEKAINNIKEFQKITKVNYISLIPWLMSIANSERFYKKSNLWVFSSVAADRGRPSNYIYGSAKAGLTTYCEGLISKFHGSEFKIRLIKPGYMLTPMSKGKAPEFLCIRPSMVAKHLLRNKRKSGIEYLPWWWFYIMQIIKFLPTKFISRL